MTPLPRVSRLLAAAVASCLAFGAAPSWSASLPGAARATAGVPAAQAPFAKVYLALRGCTSCAHCRTTIRQMAKGGSKGGEARLKGDQVEVLYQSPRVVPLRDVIRSLADNRLHDLDLVDVLFEAKGTIAKGADGVLRFTLADTGQNFAIQVPAGITRPSDGRPVRLVAVVNGWREKTGLSLTAREVHPAA